MATMSEHVHVACNNLFNSGASSQGGEHQEVGFDEWVSDRGGVMEHT
jgi:hypothetical protein